jgi:glycosyltransferase involved in cell wall biosynthesis
VRTAIVHDWLYTVGGAERVLASILRCCPSSDVFCLFDTLNPAQRAQIGYTASRTSFLQRMPRIRRNHRMYLPLMPIAIEQLDLRAYDLVISSSYAVAKGVLTGPDQLHLSYVHSPIRYAWDMQHRYLEESNLVTGLKSVMARLLLHKIRIWDTRTANAVDDYMTNSHFVARRIQKLYGRRAEVIHPPVDVPETVPVVTKQRFFLAASRLVPYKNMRVIVEAFAQLPGETLVVVGEGPERARLQSLAGSNVTFRGYVEDAELRGLMAAARAFVFAAEEDFGIVPVEAQGQGTPVIALGRGGALETVVADGAAQTGLFFDRPEPDAVRRFVAAEHRFDPANCHRNALRFARERFEAHFSAHVAACRAAFDLRRMHPPAPRSRPDPQPEPTASNLAIFEADPASGSAISGANGLAKEWACRVGACQIGAGGRRRAVMTSYFFLSMRQVLQSWLRAHPEKQAS